MAPLSAVPDAVPTDQGQADGKPKQPPVRPRTTRPLPTDRIAFQKQLAILRGFAVAAAEGDGLASANDVEKVIRTSHSTIALATPFFGDSGLLIRSDRGRFRPSEEVTEYTKGLDWSPEGSAHHLRPVIAKSWFGEIIASKVKLNPRDSDDVMAALASASGASPEHRDQIAMLIDYAILAGLVRRDGTNLRRVDGAVAAVEPAVAEPDPPVSVAPAKEGTRSGFVHDPAEGFVEFHIDVRVRTSEFSGWRPERIAAFFAGIAQVLAAKGGMEEDAATNR